MEWVETTARTREEATELALDQLGVVLEEAEVVVLEEPRPGLFGRMRGEARVAGTSAAGARPAQAGAAAWCAAIARPTTVVAHRRPPPPNRERRS